MTTYDPLAAPADPAEARGRVLARAAAWVALLLAAAAGVVAMPAMERVFNARMTTGSVLAAVALLLGVGSIRHGIRHEHERGRLAAGLAVFAALAVLCFVVAARFHWLTYG